MYFEQNGCEEQTGKNQLTERPFFINREKKALIVDEELSYSFLHSYIAYKTGLRPMTIFTKKILDKIKTLQEKDGKKTFHVSFEDIGLSFPDENISEEVAKRECQNGKSGYFFLKNIEKRIFVTIGEVKKLYQKNQKYRMQLKKQGKLKYFRLLYKPYSGIFNLIKAAKLLPGKKKYLKYNYKATKSHAAPGRLGMIAGILLGRGKKILTRARDATEAVHAAMLALQAQEILGGRTATESIKAVSLKHQAEVLSECVFYGVEHNFDIKTRFDEIEDELCTIGMWFNRSKRDLMICNSELNIVNELARIFREYSQFDEEQQCLEKVRKLNRKIYLNRHRVWGTIVWPFRFYFEYLMGALHRFLAAILLWPLLFTLLGYLFISGHKNFVVALIYSINSFFALQITSTESSTGSIILSIIAIIVGFFHLGIFISHLYTIVSRK